MAPREDLIKLVAQLAQRVVDAPDTFAPSQRNEEWTKMNFILPLLEALGWDRWADVSYERGSQDDDERLDFVFQSQAAIGVEAKALDVKPPEDRSHPQIQKGLKQSEERAASHFVWTNGDCWQFFSLALSDAPMYEVRISHARDDPAQAEQIVSDLHLMDKALLAQNRSAFDEAILDKWRTVALPAALDAMLDQRQPELLELFRQSLPTQLDIEDDEILTFLKSLELPSAPTQQSKTRARAQKSHSFPQDWQELLESFEPEYDRARTRFREGYYRKLARYLLGPHYGPWSKSTTWRHVGTPDDTNERKRLGNVIALFRQWHFIEDAEGVGMYQRVEDSVPYLRKLLE